VSAGVEKRRKRRVFCVSGEKLQKKRIQEKKSKDADWNGEDRGEPRREEKHYGNAGEGEKKKLARKLKG